MLYVLKYIFVQPVRKIQIFQYVIRAICAKFYPVFVKLDILHIARVHASCAKQQTCSIVVAFGSYFVVNHARWQKSNMPRTVLVYSDATHSWNVFEMRSRILALRRSPPPNIHGFWLLPFLFVNFFIILPMYQSVGLSFPKNPLKRSFNSQEATVYPI